MKDISKAFRNRYWEEVRETVAAQYMAWHVDAEQMYMEVGRRSQAYLVGVGGSAIEITHQGRVVKSTTDGP